MILNGGAIRRAATGYRVIYDQGVAAVNTIYGLFCEPANSGGSIETYLIPGAIPQMREWVGARQAQNLRVYEKSIKNKSWEATIEAPAELFEDDQLDALNGQVRMLGAAAAAHPDELFAEALEDGFDDEGYDGVPFFSTAHPVDVGSNQSNKGTQALDEESFQAALTAMRSLKDHRGRPVNPFGFGGKPYLIVPPALENTALAIVAKQFKTGGESNINFNRAEVKVFERLTSTSKWYLGVGGGAVKPMILQTRRKPRFVARDQAGDEEMWNRRVVQYGVDGRWALGYGMWHMLYGSTGVD